MSDSLRLIEKGLVWIMKWVGVTTCSPKLGTKKPVP